MNKLIIDQNQFKVYKIKRPLSETDDETEEFLSSKRLKYDIFNTFNPIVVRCRKSFENLIKNVPSIEREIIDEEIVKSMKCNRQVFIPCKKCSKCEFSLILNFIEYCFIYSYKYDEEEDLCMYGQCGEQSLLNKNDFQSHAISSLPLWDKYERHNQLTNIEYQSEFYENLEKAIESFRCLCEKIKTSWDSKFPSKVVDIIRDTFGNNMLDVIMFLPNFDCTKSIFTIPLDTTEEQ